MQLSEDGVVLCVGLDICSETLRGKLSFWRANMLLLRTWPPRQVADDRWVQRVSVTAASGACATFEFAMRRCAAATASNPPHPPIPAHAAQPVVLILDTAAACFHFHAAPGRCHPCIRRIAQ